jgi:hypothetical protein
VRVAHLVPKVEHHGALELYSLKRIADSSGCYCLTNATGDMTCPPFE